MQARSEAYLVCGAALILGLIAGPILRIRPTNYPAERHDEPEVALAPTPPTTPKMTQVDYRPPAIGLPSAPPRVVLPPRLTRGEILGFAERCAPNEPAVALASIVKVESSGHPLRIGINGKTPSFLDPSTPQEAALLASQLLASGANLDLGLSQINNRNLKWLGMSVEDAFDPCRNLSAAGKVMTEGYKAALKVSRPGESILETAYSLYNTGDPTRGIENGYADRVAERRHSR